MLLGALVIAHLWAHGLSTDEHRAMPDPAGWAACLHGTDHDHHVDHPHGDGFVLPVPERVPCEPVAQRTTPSLQPVMPAVPAVLHEGGPPEHHPGRGHRDRAARRHTLEVYRP
ncbi:hypothetical protein [Nonomuraea rhodomycinica]|uniref:Uncharacterized protein n=1 Tax=Nonomuraea rhodomycinica TaxID=1712872 RepID=A0A7Y6M996_9ACTN|nr:hypothetical protein [Nonomuraea rhodomycinica]NUW39407.1 hypothetical protein [Nonomuraea rhodomycinica]